ncbi:MAG: hypothetical protein A2Y15_04520 [Clostridiales bacterium GWF2_36_10]|nr:MAG: hypothetical protein A2Y15_04520 [Clostridiales bacterium GWF2_36_10]HAN20903.1 hypothetical protein [Clostridiales bacterium]
MKEKTIISRSLTWVSVGMFFLINPLLNVVDVLPDFFGYLIIYIGASKLAMLNGRLESALKKLQYLIVISALKLAITYSVISSAVDYDRLLAAFCFAIVELLLLVITAFEFFEGYEYLIIHNEGKKTASLIPNVRFLTTLFFSFKIVLSVVPELYAFIETRQQIDVSNFQFLNSLQSTRGLVTAFCLFIVLILGIIWYVNIIRMLSTTKNDEELNKKLTDRYNNEFIAYPEKQNLKSLKFGLYIALLGCIFFFDITVDGVRILPTAMAIVLFSVSAFILKRFASFTRTIKSAPYVIIIQIITEIFRYLYADNEAVFLSELDLTIVVYSSLVVVISACAVMLFMSNFLDDLRDMYAGITTNKIPTFYMKSFLFLVFIVIGSLQIVLPTIRDETSAIGFLTVALWVFLCGKRFLFIIEDYGKSIRLL